MDHDDFIKLNDGTPIEKLSDNLKIEYLQDLDMNLSIASGFTTEDIWSKPGEPFWHNGVCSRLDQTIFNPDGTATGEMTIVPCPKCECPELSSGGSGGAGGGGGFWWVMSPVYFAVIDIQPRGGGSGGSPSGPVYSPFNPQPMSPTPIAGYPLPILGAVSPELPKGGDKNCEELKKISQQIAVSNALKDLKNRIGLSQEVGYSFHSQGLSTTTQIHYGDMNGSSVNIPDGGYIYGGGHVHYNDGTPIIGASVPMFSPEDIIKLFRFIYKYNYNGANQNDLINKFVFMVTTNQGTYAIKANSMLFRTKLFAIYHDKEKKEKFILKLRNAQSSKKTSHSPESFQKQFLDFAAAENLELSLYKANSEFTQWAKLSIDSDSNTGIKEENCN